MAIKASTTHRLKITKKVSFCEETIKILNETFKNFFKADV